MDRDFTLKSEQPPNEPNKRREERNEMNLIGCYANDFRFLCAYFSDDAGSHFRIISRPIRWCGFCPLTVVFSHQGADHLLGRQLPDF